MCSTSTNLIWARSKTSPIVVSLSHLFTTSQVESYHEGSLGTLSQFLQKFFVAVGMPQL
jgi:hypothetical protein